MTAHLAGGEKIESLPFPNAKLAWNGKAWSRWNPRPGADIWMASCTASEQNAG